MRLLHSDHPETRFLHPVLFVDREQQGGHPLEMTSDLERSGIDGMRIQGTDEIEGYRFAIRPPEKNASPLNNSPIRT